MNQISLIGRLTKDPISKTSGKTIVLHFILAVRTELKNQEITFIPCVAFGKVAEIIEKYCRKGHLIGVNGFLNTSSYMKGETRQYQTEVIINTLDLLNNKIPTEKAEDHTDEIKMLQKEIEALYN